MKQFTSYIEDGKLHIGIRNENDIENPEYREFDVIEEAIKELKGYVKNGTIPSTVESFGELHEYIDANMLAEYTIQEIDSFFTEGEIPTDEEKDAFIDALNVVQNKVDELIKKGVLK